PLALLEMIDQRREHRVLIDRGIRSSALHCPSAERVRHVEHELLYGNPSPETEAKKVISPPLTRLWIVEYPAGLGSVGGDTCPLSPLWPLTSRSSSPASRQRGPQSVQHRTATADVTGSSMRPMRCSPHTRSS